MKTTAAEGQVSTSRLAAGDMLGRYRIVRLLGSGGMGCVYAAEESDSGRVVALKVLNHRLQSARHRSRFLREGRLAASLNHPNSVYVFGTEEIDGVPVIAMELVDGGTLDDRIDQRGLSTVGECVDLILQILDGLEAAAEVGVLHRDVKPANCFLTADGTVKVGDFGLSISSELRTEVDLTQSGVILGTPLFASPEQLRGDELDVRSDLYSVGVTLFNLLTGRLPFQADQMVRLLAIVLEQPAPPPSALRPEIPKGLDRIVCKCLEKQAENRYASYQQLREDLLPYRSEACAAATVGFRMVANVVDTVLVIAVLSLISGVWFDDFVGWYQTAEAMFSGFGPYTDVSLRWASFFAFAVIIGYFTVLEGLWGTSIGKQLFRLRVVGINQDASGIARACARSLTFFFFLSAPWWALYAIDAEFAIRSFEGDDMRSAETLAAWICSFSFLLSFATMRHRNGYAAVHELVSGTRVIQVPAVQARPALDAQTSSKHTPALAVSAPEESKTVLGPYHVLQTIDSRPDRELLLAYDPRLLRKVWIVRGDASSTSLKALPGPLQSISRVGRLHYLASGRDETHVWHAFEDPGGDALLNLPKSERPWNSIRFWLTDLAAELQSQAADATPVAWSLDRVWITASNRALLLDFEPPSLAIDEANGTAAVDRSDTPATFLKRVALAAIEDRIVSDADARSAEFSCRIPLKSRETLDDLNQPSAPAELHRMLRATTHGATTVSLGRRWGIMVGCLMMPLAAFSLFFAFAAAERRLLQETPEVGELSGYVALYDLLQHTGEVGRTSPAGALDFPETIRGTISMQRREALSYAIKIIVVDRYRETIRNEQIWQADLTQVFGTERDLKLLRRFLDETPPPDADQVRQAEEALEPWSEVLDALVWRPTDYELGGSFAAFVILCSVFVLCALVVLPSLLSAMLFSTSPLVRIFDCAVVDRSGRPARRRRLLIRALFFWILVLACFALAIVFAIRMSPRVTPLIVLWVLAAVFIAERGWHDRIAGTWVVPH
ncbi:protein kinase domain-containing protein [Stieleria maiorica]|uniref:protein kinase domain-containing protein n=1 Tax=Stieleria maiorica TaxID=2795974 RepID=UPI00142F362E|nr:protein kinase [Stieleria maiorica]